VGFVDALVMSSLRCFVLAVVAHVWLIFGFLAEVKPCGSWTVFSLRIATERNGSVGLCAGYSSLQPNITEFSRGLTPNR